MKKFLLFLLLFGGGLALLIYLQPETPEPDPIDPELNNQEEVGEGIQITIGEGEGEEGQQVEFIPGGAWEVTGDGERDPVTGQRPRLYHFKTTDLSRADPEEGSLAAENVTLRLFDPLTDTVRAILTANRAYLTLEAKDGGGFDIASAKPVRLESVDLTILRGAPVVPIHFRVPVLTWTRFDETFRSEDRVVLDSPGLKAEGTGMEVVSRTGSGVGFVTRLRVPDAVAVAVDTPVPVVNGRHPALPEPAEFMLQVKDGRLHTIEAFCFQGMWPADEAGFEIADSVS